MGIRVLTVEDDERIRTSVKLALEDEGWHVDEAASGEDAVTLFSHHEPDVVLIDIMLPGIDGFEVCRTLRRSSDVPIVMLTARVDTHDVVAGLEAGADDYLTKPFDLDILEARMTALIKRYRGTVASTKLQYGEVSIDQKTHQAYRQDKLLALNPTTYTILEMLVKKGYLIL